MKAPWSGQLSAAKTGWLVMLLFFGWLGYLLVPAPKPEPTSASAPEKRPPSRLVSLGLPDNPDLEHLPEFFAVYADQAEWKEDKTLFAYWNPGSNAYSYYFEAIRTNGSYRFISLPMICAAEEDQIYEGGLRWSDNLPNDCPMRFVRTDERYAYSSYDDLLNILKKSPSLKPSSALPKVELKMDGERIKLPPLDQKIPSLDVKQKK